MIIKNNSVIDPYQKASLDNIDTNKKNAAVENNSEANFTPKTDTISLSEEAKLRTQAYSDASNAPDVRAEKVARLKAEVSNGTYTPNSLRTAQAMVADMFTDKALYA